MSAYGRHGRMVTSISRPPSKKMGTGWAGIEAATALDMARENNKNITRPSEFMVKAMAHPPLPPPLFLRFECEHELSFPVLGGGDVKDGGLRGGEAACPDANGTARSTLRGGDGGISPPAHVTIDAHRSLSSLLMAGIHEAVASSRGDPLDRCTINGRHAYIRVIAPSFPSVSSLTPLNLEGSELGEVMVLLHLFEQEIRADCRKLGAVSRSAHTND